MKTIQFKSFGSFDELSEWVSKNQSRIEIINIQIDGAGTLNKILYIYYWISKPKIIKT